MLIDQLSIAAERKFDFNRLEAALPTDKDFTTKVSRPVIIRIVCFTQVVAQVYSRLDDFAATITLHGNLQKANAVR
jgi:hypothetical protein